MARIPTSALILGLAGLIPFLWGAATSVGIAVQYLPLPDIILVYSGAPMLLAYGTVILSFMSGVIWGFAAKDGGPWMPIGLTLSVLPALLIFFAFNLPALTQFIALILGFSGLLLIDWTCQRKGLAPDWWMSLRGMLTSIVLFCLVIGAAYSP
ncbi:DUF3429 domain-containing protein [Hasllibacter sp. MH4015]|uniref:DUF3429 domain-containing protein n=1 Tax=Hasllibacter sp. MH4015 TaxID=2854029 RepID=UPI001CD66EBE|nr:DUF3429 domain-containing protein [Hasllibacter sp. MH4015]